MSILQLPGTAIANSSITPTQLSSTALQNGPRVTSIVITNSSYVATGATTLPVISGGYVTISGYGFTTPCSVIVGALATANAGVIASSTSVISITQVNAQLPTCPAGVHTIYVVNSDGGTAVRVNGITFV